MTLRIALLSDVHMRTEDREAVTAALEAAVDRFERFDPDRTVVTGDLIQDADQSADRRNVERVLKILDPLSPRYLAGNHDTEHLDEETLTTYFGTDLWGRETVDGIDLVYLDTSAPHLPKARSELGPEQLSMLEDVLSGANDAILFAHHLLHYRDISDNPWFGWRPELAYCSSKEWVQQLMDRHGGVLATFNGHVHENFHARFRGTDHFTINAVNKELPDSETVTGTHALVTVDDRMRVEVYDVDGFVREWSIPR
ncbi:MAG: metallophosphoesterase family protein [Natronomonas sp.]